jgi:signal transduction histidine kinase
LWVGAGDGRAQFQAIQARGVPLERPTSIRVRGFESPFRVAATAITDGSLVYLGLSERDEVRVLRKLRIRFFALWLSIVLLGFGIVFYTSRRTLRHVRQITEAASRIGQSDLKPRVPTSQRNDEISQLALTLNHMLDRIESTVHQLHTITDSLAHDLRSPLTAIRGKLESSLAGLREGENTEPIAAAIEELDRLTDFLNKSLDVAEARADALRLTLKPIDLEQLMRVMVDLYEPSMSENGLQIRMQSAGPLWIKGDEGLIHRMVANLFDNELKHVPAACIVTVQLQEKDGEASLVLCDNGAGFDLDVISALFTKRIRGRNSKGHGLGLAFVDAVVRAHSGAIAVSNCEHGGARIVITLPLMVPERETATVSA